ncbi:hypothetical protein BJI47_14445 [Rhodococcus sp. 1168]|nr:hypothetical protein BJI47_14445 [Rhodococcus sp. 1168]
MMRSLADDASIVDEYDAIRHGKNGGTGRDENGGLGAIAAMTQFLDPGGNGVLGDGVHRRGRVVQDEHRGGHRRCPGQCDTLTLTARQAGPSIGDGVVEATLVHRDDIGSGGRGKYPVEFVVLAGTPGGYVGPHGAREQVCVVRFHQNCSTRIGQSEFTE